MATSNFFLIRMTQTVDPNSKNFIKSLDLPAGTTTWRAGQEWFGVRRDDRRELWYLMEAISLKLKAEAIGVLVQPDKGSFELRCFNLGKQTRRLNFASHADGWTVAQGQEQDWEHQVLFNQTRMDASLKKVQSNNEREQIRNVFAERKIIIGSFVPSADDDSVAGQILDALACRFPAASKKKEKPKNWLQKLLGF